MYVGGIQVRRCRIHSPAQRAIRFTVEDIELAYSWAKTRPTSASISRHKLGIELDTSVYGVATIERRPKNKNRWNKFDVGHHFELNGWIYIDQEPEDIGTRFCLRRINSRRKLFFCKSRVFCAIVNGNPIRNKNKNEVARSSIGEFFFLDINRTKQPLKIRSRCTGAYVQVLTESIFSAANGFHHPS